MKHNLPLAENSLPIAGYYLIEPMCDSEHVSKFVWFPRGVILAPFFGRTQTEVVKWKIFQPPQELGKGDDCFWLDHNGGWRRQPVIDARETTFWQECLYKNQAEAMLAWQEYLNNYPHIRHFLEHNQKKG